MSRSYRSLVESHDADNVPWTETEIADAYTASFAFLGDALDWLCNTIIGDIPADLLDRIVTAYTNSPQYADKVAELHAAKTPH